MRIIGGRYRGRKLAHLNGANTRPTSDRVREQIFNILIHRFDFSFEGCRVADVFAGTGALGLEAISRGANEVTFVESDRKAAGTLAQNIEALGAEHQARIISTDARRVPAANLAFDILFLDPPYGHGLVDKVLPKLLELGWVNETSLVVVELGGGEEINLPKVLTCVERRASGGTEIIFLKMGQPA